MKKLMLALFLLPMLMVSPAWSAPALPIKGDYTLANNANANAWLEIDLAVFENNIARVQKHIGNSQLCAILKADAYGHGIDLLMPSVIKMNVPCIGIASNDEAKVARAHGYQGRIMRVRLASVDEMTAGANISNLIS